MSGHLPTRAWMRDDDIEDDGSDISNHSLSWNNLSFTGHSGAASAAVAAASTPTLLPDAPAPTAAAAASDAQSVWWLQQIQHLQRLALEQESAYDSLISKERMERDAQRAAHHRELSECQRALAEQKTHTQCLQTTMDQQLATIARLEAIINTPTLEEKISVQHSTAENAQLKHKLESTQQESTQQQLAAARQQLGIQNSPSVRFPKDYPQMRARLQDLEFKLGQSEHERSILKSSYFARHYPTPISSDPSTKEELVLTNAKGNGATATICKTLAPACKTEGWYKDVEL